MIAPPNTSTWAINPCHAFTILPSALLPCIDAEKHKNTEVFSEQESLDMQRYPGSRRDSGTAGKLIGIVGQPE